MNERQQVLTLLTHCSVDLYFFTYIKNVVYLSKTGKENIINFQTGPLCYHFEGH